jgi:hypothetical protein
MTYRELLEYVKSHPGCLQTKTQQKKESENRFREWLRQQDKDTRIYTKDKQANS